MGTGTQKTSYDPDGSYGWIKNTWGFKHPYNSHADNGFYKDGFIVTMTRYDTVSNLKKGFDEDDNTSFRSSISPKLPCQIRIIFPRPYAISGFILSACDPTYYCRLKQFDIYIKTLDNDTFSTKIYSSEELSNNIFRLDKKFDKIYPNVTGVALQVNSRYKTNSFGFSNFNIYNGDGLILVKQGSNYYNISNYNPTNLTYDSISYPLNFMENSFFLENLLKEVTINGETFRPIDKFDNFQIVQQSNIPLKVLGCKSKSELIVTNNDIDTSRASTIHSFRSLQNISGNGDIKLVLSIDKGKTWNSYDTESLSLIPLNITIPLLPYSILSEDEKENWRIAKETIQTCGISTNIFHSIDFNNLTEQLNNVRFSYLISKEAYQDTAELDQLSWSFDAKGIMRKMANDEFNVHTHINKIIVEPLINTQILKTNILI